MRQRIYALLPFVIITMFCIAIVEGSRFAALQFLGGPQSEVKAVARSVPQKIVTVASPRRSTEQNAQVILKRNLFGSEPEDTEPPAAKSTIALDELQATSLALVLLGTTVSDGVGDVAIILNKTDKKQDIYRVGDSVAEAEIKQILRGKVVLNVGGNDEILDMLEAANYAGKAPVAAASTRRIPQTVAPPQQAFSAEVEMENTRVILPPPSGNTDAGTAAGQEPGSADEQVEPADETAGQADSMQEETSQPGEESSGQPRAARTQRKFSLPLPKPAAE
jgi:type II secretory pathway component PulC